MNLCRQAAVQAAQEVAKAKDEAARHSFALLAVGWGDLAGDLERRLNDDRESGGR
jgi:hypothetical protein